MFGSLIADYLRGSIDPALAPGVRRGIALHRSVDTFTDSHADVAAARALFDPPYRRYAGIFLDVWFDHLLARGWSRHGMGTLHAFSASVQSLLATRTGDVPARMGTFVSYLQQRDLPLMYRERDVIGQVFQGISSRLSRANPMATALPVIEANAAAVERHFDAFFPDLVAHAARERERLAASIG